MHLSRLITTAAVLGASVLAAPVNNDNNGLVKVRSPDLLAEREAGTDYIYTKIKPPVEEREASTDYIYKREPSTDYIYKREPPTDYIHKS